MLVSTIPEGGHYLFDLIVSRHDSGSGHFIRPAAARRSALSIGDLRQCRHGQRLIGK
jgi:hypothetical protein